MKYPTTTLATALAVLLALSAAAAENVNADDVRDLQERVAKLEKRLAEPADADRPGADILVEEVQKVLSTHGVELGLLLEVEAAWQDAEHAEAAGDLVLATFELGLAADVEENIGVEAALLWEEDDTEPIDLDTAVIEFRNVLNRPLTITAGKMYVPFGKFGEAMLTDPLTQDMAETRETAAAVAWEAGRACLTFAAFNGNVDEDDLNNLVAKLDVVASKAISAGACYISDIRETDTLQDIIAGTGIAGHRVSGAGGYVSVTIRDLMLCGEYLQANRRLAAGCIDAAARRPYVWTLEVLYGFRTGWSLGARYEQSGDLPGFADERYGVTVSHELREHITISAECLHSNFDEGSDIDALTAQLAVEY